MNIEFPGRARDRGLDEEWYGHRCKRHSEPIILYDKTWDAPRMPSPSLLPHHLMSALNSTILTGEGNKLVAGAVGVAAILTTTILYYALISKDKEHDFPKLQGIQLYHAWNFFQRRYDFLQSNFKRNLGKSFSFNVIHHNIIALTGEGARQVFYSNPHLDLNEGYKILMGAVRDPLTQQQNLRLILMIVDTPDQ